MPTYTQFLENEAKLTQASRAPTLLAQRFFQLHAIPEAERDQPNRVEYEILDKAMRARWRALEADMKAKKLVATIEANNRKANVHAKVLLGIAAIELAHKDTDLRTKLLSLAGGMPSANKDYLAALLNRST